MNELMINIKNLRELTSAGFLDCKKALEENNNNLDSSVDFLRKKGLIKANKKSSREAKEGAVGVYLNNDFTIILQINTETDFAAKNEVFLSFMDEIAGYVFDVNDSNLSIEIFNEMLFSDRSIGDKFKDIIAKIGENIILSKLILIKKNSNIMISNYIHNEYKKNVGKIAVVLQSKVDNENNEAKLFGKNLCMHIAASKPLAINIEKLDKKLIDKEREIQIETIKSSGKPDNIMDKILEGKMKKYYSESTFLNQNYILDPDKTINQIIEEFSIKNKFEVVDYNLVVLGF